MLSRALKPVNTRATESQQQQQEHHGNQETAIFDRTERETKLELYQTDPLVDVKGLKRYTYHLDVVALHAEQDNLEKLY